MNHLVEIPLDQIEVSILNTRKNLKQGAEDTSLEDLARSIQEQGLLNPISVRPLDSGQYEVFAGQRRTLAFRLLGKSHIPAFVCMDLADKEALALSLIENMQRAEMAPLDKARSLHILVEQYGSAAEAAKRTGISYSTVRRYLSLMSLPSAVVEEFQATDGIASVAVAATIATTFKDQDDMKEAWDKVKGFRAGIAERVVKSSGGSLDRLRETALLAAEGAFDLLRCGSNLATCPHVPLAAREEILRIAQNLPD